MGQSRQRQWAIQLSLGVAVDRQGNVYVADTYNNRIQKFNSQGGFLDVWSNYSPGNGQFFQPQAWPWVAATSMWRIP